MTLAKPSGGCASLVPSYSLVRAFLGRQLELIYRNVPKYFAADYCCTTLPAFQLHLIRNGS
jgi:hypothetical protein